MNVLEKVNSMMDNHSENKAAKKALTVEQVAKKHAQEEYNILRVDGIDYITHFGYIVSMPDDAKNGNLCDRLDEYRQAYVKKCVAEGKVPGENI